ncbi:DUF4123 domain-containing protein [Aeromonas schubertii]|uniref:DUF4123 domain-containing protein n=1 Tax=Aeromonas schubertii TaxID=652 RepID=A0A0S2SDJ4_9GAMM|nr:DUF4123 domain-containing protein [Aeromonas schubertii]ALP39789.1 hypothetical protein WL1483_370 [Aeromonas schubertii]
MVLPEFELAKDEHLYLLLDGAQLPELERQLFEVVDSPAYQPLYLYSPWDSLREVSPCLVEASVELLEWFQTLPANGGGLLSSSLRLLPLAERLRALIEVESPYGSRILLKLAQPDGMYRLLQDDEPWLWEGIRQVWTGARQQLLPNAPVQWWHKRVAPTLGPRQGERLRLSDPQWARLGEVTWLSTLDIIWRHMEKWFPERLAEQVDAGAWVSHWANKGYPLGFHSERDLLFFFNVLGYLGDTWWDTGEYPEVQTLLRTLSSQTPSQRVEQAAIWAERHVMTQEISS